MAIMTNELSTYLATSMIEFECFHLETYRKQENGKEMVHYGVEGMYAYRNE
jgi:hypothetical protein